jgi:hypothetical protein
VDPTVELSEIIRGLRSIESEIAKVEQVADVCELEKLMQQMCNYL